MERERDDSNNNNNDNNNNNISNHKIRGRLSLTHFEVFLPSHDTGVCVRVCVRVRA